MNALASSKRRFTCPICDCTVNRQSRQQIYCSSKCMRRANYARKAGLALLLGQDTALVPDPHKSSNENNILQWPKTVSGTCHNGRSDGIVGPAKVIHAEVIAGRDWQEVVSSGGVTIYVSRLTTRALRDGGVP